VYTLIVYYCKHVSIVCICCAHSYGVHLVMFCITCVLLQAGQTALNIALRYGHEEMATMFVIASADIKIIDNVRDMHYNNMWIYCMCVL